MLLKVFAVMFVIGALVTGSAALIVVGHPRTLAACASVTSCSPGALSGPQWIIWTPAGALERARRRAGRGYAVFAFDARSDALIEYGAVVAS